MVDSRWWTQGDGQWARSPEIPVLTASVAYVEAFLTGRYVVLKKTEKENSVLTYNETHRRC